MSKPNQDRTEQQGTSEELGEESLEQVSGGLLLPAVQKVRDAAARTTSTETAALNFTKVEL